MIEKIIIAAVILICLAALAKTLIGAYFMYLVAHKFGVL